VFERLRASGIGVNLHYIPVHTQPYYKNLGFKQGQFPIAETYYGDAISIPLSHVMTNEQQNEVVTVLSKVLV
jgi:dTDP-4-amino-4,6-dideoxygalactose transaminase